MTTLNLHITLTGMTATWQDKELVRTLPADFTAEQFMTTLETTVLDALAGDEPDNMQITNDIMGLVALDESSNSIGHILTADQADEHFIEALTMNGIGGQLMRKNGYDLSTAMPVIQILRLKNNDVTAYDQAVTYRPLTTHIRAILTGWNSMTPAEAMHTGLFDQFTQAWDTQALALTGLTVIQLPEIGEGDGHVLTNQNLIKKISTLPMVKVH